MTDSVLVQLRRNVSATAWGFSIQGGQEHGSCIFIQKVKPKSIADRSGLRVGDGVEQIGHTPTQYLRHDQAKMEIIRAGNDLDLYVRRNAVNVSGSNTVTPENSYVVEDSTDYRGYTNPNVQSRSFKILQDSLQYTEVQEGK
ncbi:PDZ and LIM domain protein 7-like [Pecten maximus]|uniref:PDZ and LIM domain protein 7-like n=1 Tax=Pecten maximus TaxID=6579 RepID=UPI0014591322|nr:PDZ and LIM domain protein 7-like [Pecten maximus]